MSVSPNIHKRTLFFSNMSSRITEFAFGKGQACPPLKPGVLRLYSMRFCPWAQRTRLVLEHKEIPFETVNVYLKKKPEWLFDMNPTGVVPVLQWDDHVIYESATCNDYLDEAFPQKKLNPKDPYKRARDRQLWESIGKLVSSFYDVGPGLRNNDRTALDRMLRAFTRYEKELVSRGDGPYFGGKSVCMADFMIWPWFERLCVLNAYFPETRLTDSNFPRLASWMRHMYELSAVKKTMFDREHHQHFMKTLKIDKNPDYDYGLVKPAQL